jgi:hypothetical protein
MNDSNLQDTVNSLRRIATTGAVAAVVLLVGAVVLMASSALFSVARFSPFGAWGVLAVLVAALVAGALAWSGGSRAAWPLPGRRRRTLAADIVYREPPPAPVRAPRATPALLSGSGRLGAQSAVNQLIEQRRYAEALARLEELEREDPSLTEFCVAKRRAVARRQTLGR